MAGVSPEVLGRHLSTTHALVGKHGLVNARVPDGYSIWTDKEVEITAVSTMHGQVLGYQVRQPGLERTIELPVEAVYVDDHVSEDVHYQAPLAQQIERVLRRWKGSCDYWGPSWNGIDLLHFELAKLVDEAAIEVAGWYRYASSPQDLDGKDWRYVIPMREGVVEVHCHSLLHDEVWTLVPTVFSTDTEPDWDKLDLSGHEDHWTRVCEWTLRLIRGLQVDGMQYDEAMRRYRARLEVTDFVRQLSDGIFGDVRDAARQVVDGDLAPVSVGVSPIRVEPGHVGRYEPPDDLVDYGLISVHPSALRDHDYLGHVITHEMLHHVVVTLGDEEDEHGEMFKALADAMGVPEEYQD